MIQVQQQDREKIIRKNTIICVLDGSSFNLGSAFIEANTVLPTFVSTLTNSPVLVGMVSAIRSLGYLLPQMFVAAHIERLPERKPFMMKAGVAMRLAAALFVLSAFAARSNPALALASFFVFLTVLSFGDGFGSLPWMDIVARTIPSDRRGRLFGTMQFLGGSSAFLAGFVIQRILKEYPWPQNYAYLFALGAFFLSLSLFFVGFLYEPRSQTTSASGSIRDLLKMLPELLRQDRVLRGVLLVRVLVGSIYLSAPFYTVFALNKLGFSTSTTGLFVSAQMLGSVVAGPVWGIVGDRKGPHHVVRWVTVLYGLTGALALLSGLVAPIGQEMALVIYLALYAVLGAAYGGTWLGFSNYVLDIAPDERRATYVGLLNTLPAPLTFLPAVGGLVASAMSYGWVFALEATIEALAAALAFRLPNPRD